MFAALFCGCGNAKNNESVKTVKTEEFAEMMAQKDVRLIDVRTPKEYAEGHLAGAENIDVKAADFAERIKDIKGTVAVYCRSGKRSLKAAEQLVKQGCTVYNLDGGILAWHKAGKPTSIVEADILLVTHEHFDHYDTTALRQLITDGTQLIMNPRCVELYGSGQAMKNGDRQQLADDIMLEAVPAYNTTEGHLQFHPKGRDNGYILTLDGLRIYIAGDTEDIPEMDNIKDIDVAFLPCNQPYTMTPGQLVRAAKIFKPKVLFPYHYGETNVSGIPAQLPGIDVRIRHYE